MCIYSNFVDQPNINLLRKLQLLQLKKNVRGIFGVSKPSAKNKSNSTFRDPSLHPPPAPSHMMIDFVENSRREMVRITWRMIADTSDDASHATSQTILNLCRFEVCVTRVLLLCVFVSFSLGKSL